VTVIKALIKEVFSPAPGTIFICAVIPMLPAQPAPSSEPPGGDADNIFWPSGVTYSDRDRPDAVGQDRIFSRSGECLPHPLAGHRLKQYGFARHQVACARSSGCVKWIFTQGIFINNVETGADAPA